MKVKSDVKQQILLFFHSLTWKLLCVTVCLFFLFAGIVTRVWTQRMTSQASETASRDLYSIMQVSNNNFGTALKEDVYKRQAWRHGPVILPLLLYAVPIE